jgi:hypothetical protein
LIKGKERNEFAEHFKGKHEITELNGDNSSYAIRELIQNATDACKSRKAIDNNSYKPKIEITYNVSEFIIKDNGIGMDIDVIKKYFLRIGSSFSESKIWNELNDSRIDKNSHILRNGRFGIGILSSYLIGNKIHVKTRKLENDYVYIFETEKDEKAVVITKDKEKSQFIGTEIRIPTRKGVNLQDAMTEWYRMDDVEIIINNENKDKLIELYNENQNWIDLKTSNLYGLNEVKWSYNYKISSFTLEGKKGEKPSKYEPNLVCNGIIIPERYDKTIESYIVNKWPVISIKDSKGIVNLDLSRKELNSNLPFIKELEQQLLSNFVNELNDISKKESGNESKIIKENTFKLLSRFKIDNFKDQRIIFTINGYAIFNKYFMEKNKLIRVVRIWTKQQNIYFNKDYLEDSQTAYIFEGYNSHPNLKSEIVNNEKDFLNSESIKIYLPKTDFENYQKWPANIYRLNQKFIDKNLIYTYEDLDKDYIRNKFNLNIDTSCIQMVIEYKYGTINDDGSDIFKDYFEDKYLIPYVNNLD